MKKVILIILFFFITGLPVVLSIPYLVFADQILSPVILVCWMAVSSVLFFIVYINWIAVWINELTKKK